MLNRPPLPSLLQPHRHRGWGPLQISLQPGTSQDSSQVPAPALRLDQVYSAFNCNFLHGAGSQGGGKESKENHSFDERVGDFEVPLLLRHLYEHRLLDVSSRENQSL